MALLAGAFAAYNSRDVDRLLAAVGDDVDWPDGAARLHGKDAVRRYWLEQWTRVRTHDEPVAFAVLGRDVAEVRIEQVVRDLDGRVVSAGAFRHTFHLRDGRIARLDIAPLRGDSWLHGGSVAL